jgi:hypothetical protein
MASASSNVTHLEPVDCASASHDGMAADVEVSIAEARWLGLGAFLIDLVFGYGPSYVGFWLALLACNPDAQDFTVLVDPGSALLAAVVGYLMVARFLLRFEGAGASGASGSVWSTVGPARVGMTGSGPGCWSWRAW